MKLRLAVAGIAAAALGATTLGACSSASADTGTKAASKARASVSVELQPKTAESVIIECSQNFIPGTQAPLQAQVFGPAFVASVAQTLGISEDKAKKIGMSEVDVFTTRKVTPEEAKYVLYNCAKADQFGDLTVDVNVKPKADGNPWAEFIADVNDWHLPTAKPYRNDNNCFLKSYKIPGGGDTFSEATDEFKAVVRGVDEFWSNLGYSAIPKKPDDVVKIDFSTGCKTGRNNKTSK